MHDSIPRTQVLEEELKVRDGITKEEAEKKLLHENKDDTTHTSANQYRIY